MDFNEKFFEAENLSSMDLLHVGWSLQETGLLQYHHSALLCSCSSEKYSSPSHQEYCPSILRCQADIPIRQPKSEPSCDQVFSWFQFVPHRSNQTLSPTQSYRDQCHQSRLAKDNAVTLKCHLLSCLPKIM